MRLEWSLRSLVVVGVLVLVAAGAAAAVSVARQPAMPEGFTPLYRLLARPPETSEPWLRAWWAYRDDNVGVAYAVVPRDVPMHVHLDAEHVITVVEGWAGVTVGGRSAILGKGDTVVVPRGMAHSIARRGQGRLLLHDVSVPPGDMDRTFWIEQPPAAAPPARPAAPPAVPPAGQPAASPPATPPASPAPGK